MGSIDIPPFLREKMKQNIKNNGDKAAEPETIDVPNFLKKNETLPTTGKDLQAGTNAMALASKGLGVASTYVGENGKSNVLLEEGKTEDIPKKFLGMDKESRFYTPQSPKALILKPIEPEIAVSVNTSNGPQKFIITPSKVPEGYEKTIEGAKKYAQDISTLLLNSSINKDEQNFNTTLKNVAKTAQLGKLENNDATVSLSDLTEINNILGTNVTEVSDDVLGLLKNRQRQINSERSQLYPEKGFDILKSNRELADVTKYIKKVAQSLQEEQSSEGSINVLGADTRSDLQATFSSLDATIKNYSSRFNTEQLSNAFATGVESLKYTNKNLYEIEKSRIESGKTLSSAKVAEYTNIGAKIIDARNLEKLERGELDIDQYAEKSNEIISTLDKTLYSHPDILQKQIAGIIAKHYERDGSIVFDKWFVSDDKIDAVPESEFVEAGIDMNRPESKAALKSLKQNEGILPFDNAIQKDGLIREFGRGFMQPLKGVSDFVGNIGVSDNEKRVQRELEPLTNYEKQRSEYFNKHYGGIADAFNGAGQVISQYLLMEAGIGALRTVGAAAGGVEALNVVKVPAGVTPTAVREGTKIGNYIIDKSQLWSSLGVPYIQSYDPYLKSALEKTNNPLAAKAAAFVGASMESLSEQLFNNVKFGRQVIANFKNAPENLANIAKIFDRGVLDEAAQKEFRETIQSGLKKAMKAAGEGGVDLAKESFEEVPVAFTQFVTDALLNPQSVENRQLLPELKDAFLAGMVSFSIPSILGVGGRIKKQFNNTTTQNDALMIAARNKSDVLDAIYNQVEDGELDKDEANLKIKILNNAEISLNQLPKSYIDGKEISEADRVKYLSLSVQERMIKEENSKIEDEPIQKANEQKIKEINIQKAEILGTKPIEDEPLIGQQQQEIEKPLSTTSEEPLLEQTEDSKISFRKQDQIDTILKDVDEELTSSQRRLQRDIPDVVNPNKVKMSAKDFKNRATTLQELIVNCLT